MDAINIHCGKARGAFRGKYNKQSIPREYRALAQATTVEMEAPLVQTAVEVFLDKIPFEHKDSLSQPGALFSCPEQLCRTHCPSVPLTKLTIRVLTTLQSEPRDL